MLCDDCQKRSASVHITQITNNQKVDKRLCHQCAQNYGELGFGLNSNFSVHDFLKNMFAHNMAEGIPLKQEAACPNCGMTYPDFSRIGKVGCSSCYTVFAQRLEPLLRRIQGAAAHTGKVPKRTGGNLELKQRLRKMRHDLERYVANEEYEQAAKIRDQIRHLENEIKGDQ